MRAKVTDKPLQTVPDVPPLTVWDHFWKKVDTHYPSTPSLTDRFELTEKGRQALAQATGERR